MIFSYQMPYPSSDDEDDLDEVAEDDEGDLEEWLW